VRDWNPGENNYVSERKITDNSHSPMGRSSLSKNDQEPTTRNSPLNYYSNKYESSFNNDVTGNKNDTLEKIPESGPNDYASSVVTNKHRNSKLEAITR
jgi:hypothetical protein